MRDMHPEPFRRKMLPGITLDVRVEATNHSGCTYDAPIDF